jgi:hypothetical protein
MAKMGFADKGHAITARRYGEFAVHFKSSRYVEFAFHAKGSRYVEFAFHAKGGPPPVEWTGS